MKMKTQIRVAMLSLAVLLGMSATSTAQETNARSPYSRYGYGQAAEGNTAGSRSMGGLSVGLRDRMVTNPGNPASYTAVDSMTFIFDVGLSGRYAFLNEGGNSDSRILGNLEYVTMIYPLGKRMAMSAGIMPLYKTGYSFGNQANMGGDTNSDTFSRAFSGSGSYNQIYIGLAGRTIAGLHLGLNASYLFGHTQHNRQVSYSTARAINSTFSSDLHLRGFKLDLGAQYELKLDTTNTRSVVIGATYTPGYKFADEMTATQADFSGTSPISSTITVTEDGRYTMPHQMGLGISYRKANSFMYGVDFRYSMWSKAEFTKLEAQFQDQWRVALGGEWTPDNRARNPWKRAAYRAGLSLGNSYLQIPMGNKYYGYNEYGASVGFALPLVDRRSALNFSIDYKLLTPKNSAMISEHYIGATVGIIFNEGWFKKARVN